MYESWPHVVIVTLGNKLYMILEVPSLATISLVTAKQCSKLISKTRKFVFLMIMEEYQDIFTSPTGVPLHCQVKHPINLTPGALLPNGPIYRHSVLENDEIKRQVLELL